MAEQPAGPEPEEPPPEGATPPAPPSPAWRRIRRYVIVALVSPLAALAVYTAIMLRWEYSSGERSGALRSFERRGWICKTWEGELSLDPQPGAEPVRWAFTVRNDEVARRITPAVGRRAILHYREHRGLLTSCFGETRFFVDSIAVMEGP